MYVYIEYVYIENIEDRKAYSIYLVLFKAAAPFSWIHEISTLKSCGWVQYLQSSILFSTLFGRESNISCSPSICTKARQVIFQGCEYSSRSGQWSRCSKALPQLSNALKSYQMIYTGLIHTLFYGDQCGFTYGSQVVYFPST